MQDSFEAVAVFLVALLPGALYVWAFERQAGRWGIGLSDRVLRFVGGSAIFHALLAPLTFRLWFEQWPDIREGSGVGLVTWLLILAYVLIPVTLGTLVGTGTRKGRAWSRWLTGPYPAPRAWDFLLSGETEGWIRFKLKSGVWLAGVYAKGNERISYASGYPEVQELFLSVGIRVDPDTGEFTFDDNGDVYVTTGGLLVRWEEIEYLEFIEG
jgi:hypothetical protein